MNKFQIKEEIDSILYRTYNLIVEFIWYFDFKTRNILAKNLIFKNIHAGERCFILGTGPSLNLITNSQLNYLKSETIFGTNSLYKVDSVSYLFPKYYALLDNLYWESWSSAFKDIVEKYEKSPPIFITDLRAQFALDKINLTKKSLYIYSKKYPVSKMTDQLHKNIYAAQNVVSYSILAAMYMGFKEIYLLGCDYNAFCAMGYGHAYDDKTELSQSNYDLAFYLKFYSITTQFHYLIQKLARSQGVEIINLTPGSLLDAYPKKNLHDVLH